MAYVITNNQHYINIANAIRDNSFGNIEGPLPVTELAQCVGEISAIGQAEGYAQGLEEGKQAGIQSEYDRFWDAFQVNGTRTDYQHAFRTEGWNDTNFAPKYNIVPIGYAGNMMLRSRITNLAGILHRCGVVLDTRQATNLEYAFSSSSITHIPAISTVGMDRVHYIFGYCQKLISIEKLILKEDGTQTFTQNIFWCCDLLENIVIEGKIGQNGFNVSWSTKLTHDSLMSIINALKDYSEDTSGTTWAITLGTTNLAKLTDAEKVIATQRGWTLA